MATDKLLGPVRVGLMSSVAGYRVVVAGDTVVVRRNGELVTAETVRGLGVFVQSAKRLACGWAALPDFEVVYLYDKGDGGFGYAVNLQDDWCSEWGYAPFPADDETEGTRDAA